MDGWTWIGYAAAAPLVLYANVAIAGGIIAANVIRAIEEQGKLTRDAIEEMSRELGEKLDLLDSTLSSIERHTWPPEGESDGPS